MVISKAINAPITVIFNNVDLTIAIVSGLKLYNSENEAKQT